MKKLDELGRFTFLLVDNPRLDYRDSRKRVQQFIAARLSGFLSAQSIYVPSRQALPSTAAGLLASANKADFVVIADMMCPVFDLELVAQMAEALMRNECVTAHCDGAVPGTEVTAVYSTAQLAQYPGATDLLVLDEAAVTVPCATQGLLNNQFNLYKYKRLKVFLALVERNPDLARNTITEFVQYLESDEGFEIAVSFGEKVRLEWHEKCLHCGGRLNPLASTMSQPFCGYIPASRPIYHQCERCGLVMLSPSISAEDVHRVYDEWDKQDFVVSTNNPYVDGSVRCDFSHITPYFPACVRSLDLGGGIGNFSRYLKQRYPDWDVTHSDYEIKTDVVGDFGVRTIDFCRESIGNEKYDLITAWEVIEHVSFPDFERVLKNVWRALAKNGHFIFSTPDYDSPLCKSFDFFAACPPFHFLVFGQKWLSDYFRDSILFEIVDVRHCSDFLDDADNWYQYGQKACPSMALRAQSRVLQEIFRLDESGAMRRALNRQGIGTELVMTLRKK